LLQLMLHGMCNLYKYRKLLAFGLWWTLRFVFWFPWWFKACQLADVGGQVMGALWSGLEILVLETFYRIYQPVLVRNGCGYVWFVFDIKTDW